MAVERATAEKEKDGEPKVDGGAKAARREVDMEVVRVPVESRCLAKEASKGSRGSRG